MRPLSLGIGVLVLLAAAVAGPASAAAPPVLAGAFDATVSGSGHYELRATLTGGGSFTVRSDPAWTAVYPQVIVPEASVGAVHRTPAPDVRASAVTGANWTIGGSLPGVSPSPLTLVTCLGLLQTPDLATAAIPPSMDATGARVQVVLPALPAISPATSSCTPSQADGRLTWSGDLRTWTAGIVATSTQELLGADQLQRPVDVTTVAGAEGRTIGACHVSGTCDQDLRWTGLVTLVKRCRNFAGVAQDGGSGAFTCASPCRERTCSLEEAQVLAGPALRPRRGSVRAPAACYGDTACAGTAELRAGGRVVGRAGFRLRPTAAGTVTVRLRKTGTARLHAVKALRATLVLRLTGGAVRAPASAVVTLRR